MQKQYDDFVKMKSKEMSKAISDMTYTYLDPLTKQPTKVPASHYEKILNKVKEQYIADATKQTFLNTMYVQLKALRDEEPKYFQKALLCLDMGLKPSDLRVDEQIALQYTQDALEEKQREDKKNYHIIDRSIIEYFECAKNDVELQSMAVQTSNEYDDKHNGLEI